LTAAAKARKIVAMRCAASIVAVCLAASAMADRTVAQDAYQRGIVAFRKHNYARARDLFQRAMQEQDDPALLFNIAQSSRMLGDRDNARAMYRAYLDRKSDAPNRAEVERILVELDNIATDTSTVTVIHKAPPVYKRWWLWTAVGLGAAAVLSVGLGVGLYESARAPTANTDLGTFQF
jgi:hypothetical protein